MTTEIEQAFAALEARAATTAGEAPRDRIALRDHIVRADVGAFQTERGRRQRLRFNVVLEVGPARAPVADDVDRILSYDMITEAIAAALAGERANLLETLAERVAARVLAAPQAMRAFVRIEKLDRGPGALGVEIVRTRAAVPAHGAPAHGTPGDGTPGDGTPGDGTPGDGTSGDGTSGDGAQAALHPLVAFLDNAAIADPGLPGLIERLVAAGPPVVLAVGLPETPAPTAAVAAAQRRIELLAIEQNAWVLAGRDRRCVVVSSRTEIDWAMRSGTMIVWAPSKLVLDAQDGPKAPRDALALALWLAETLAAEALLITGSQQPPAGSRVPVVRAAPGTLHFAGVRG